MSWASCSTNNAFHQEPLVKLYLLMKNANRSTTQVWLLTFGIKSVLGLQICPYRHEFLNILLTDFYREEIPFVEVGLFLKEDKSFVKSFYKQRKI